MSVGELNLAKDQNPFTQFRPKLLPSIFLILHLISLVYACVFFVSWTHLTIANTAASWYMRSERYYRNEEAQIITGDSQNPDPKNFQRYLYFPRSF